MKKGIIYSILLILITTIFAIQNAEKVIIKFLFFKIAMPLALIIIICLIIGIIIGILINKTLPKNQTPK